VSSSDAQGSGVCQQPAISANGRFVAFVDSSRLLPAASSGVLELFVGDLNTRQTRLVSISSARPLGHCFRLPGPVGLPTAFA
jgi:hypothetical protein